MDLNQLSDNAGARRGRKRVGRGPGSGLGKTAGRGQKGQKSRTGVAIKGFEGGQMPIYRRLPKRGFTKPFATKYQELTLARLQAAVDKGTLDAAAPITEERLVETGVVRRRLDGVRLIGKGELKAKLTVEVTSASRGAAAAIEAAGGTLAVKVPPKEKTPRRDRAAEIAAAADQGQDGQS